MSDDGFGADAENLDYLQEKKDLVNDRINKLGDFAKAGQPAAKGIPSQKGFADKYTHGAVLLGAAGLLAGIIVTAVAATSMPALLVPGILTMILSPLVFWGIAKLKHDNNAGKPDPDSIPKPPKPAEPKPDTPNKSKDMTKNLVGGTPNTVSYTHLTLPTSPKV